MGNYSADPFANIALALSGGGFRAASFSLGTMSYLDSLPWEEGTLLEKVSFISSTSGGSITNAFYTLGRARGKSSDVVMRELYQQLRGKRLMAAAMERLTTASAWEAYPDKAQNLINAFAITYHEDLFDQEIIGATIDTGRAIHLKEVVFNCAELNNGISFRFQWRLTNPAPKDMGNTYIHFVAAGRAAMKNLRLGDILAASSCFPIGFEPIVFPADFASASTSADTLWAAVTKEHNHALSVDQQPASFGLMDGGAIDNQGIYSLTLEDGSRVVKISGEKVAESETGQPFSLMIITDVASYFMDHYAPPRPSEALWRKIPLLAALPAAAVAVVLPVVAALAFAWQGVPWYDYLALVPACLLSLAIIAGFVAAERSLNENAALPAAKVFEEYRLQMLKKPLGWWWDAILARKRSFTTLASDMFLKQIRRLYQRDFYEDPVNHGRIISNFIYALSLAKQSPSKAADPTAEPAADELSPPSYVLQLIAEDARKVATTLWFGEDDAAELDKVVATGQFTICYNLLLFLKRRKKAIPEGLSPALEALQARLLEDWRRFNEAPLCKLDLVKGDVPTSI